MFANYLPTMNNLELNQNVAQSACHEAINKISALTGLSEQQSLTLLNQQLKTSNSRQEIHKTTHTKAILEHTEYQYISALFN